MASNDTSMIMKYLIIVVLISSFAILLNDWDDTSATVTGYDNLQDTIEQDDTADDDFPQFPDINPPPDQGGILPDIPGAIIYIGELIFGGLIFILSVIFWIVVTAFSLVLSLFGVATLTMDGMPIEIQALIWAFSLPMFFLIMWSLLKLIRGTEG